MNAQIAQGFSFHGNTNRNRHHLVNFIGEHNLIFGNISFQKHVNKLWTNRSPKGNLSQIDFVMYSVVHRNYYRQQKNLLSPVVFFWTTLYRKRWRNSISNVQAYSSSNPVGSNHRIVQQTSNSVSVVQTPSNKEIILGHSLRSCFSN